MISRSTTYVQEEWERADITSEFNFQGKETSKMTPKIFRVLLVSSLVTGLIAGLIDICIPSVLPKEFAQAQAAYDSSLSDMTMIVVGPVMR